MTNLTVDAQSNGAGSNTDADSNKDSVEVSGAQDDGGTSSAEDGSAQNLSPELEATRKELMRDYHSKMQTIKEDRLRFETESEKLKTANSTLEQLMQQEWFKNAANAERARRQGQITDFNLTEEQFEAAKTDKSAFLKLVQTVADQVASARVGKVEPELGDTRKRLDAMATDRDLERVASNPKYKDFKALNDKGALDVYLKKGHDFETAYAKYKLEHPSAPAAAPITDEDKRSGSVSAGGATQVRGQRVIEAKNFEDAWDQVWAAHEAGEKNVKVVRAKK
mgnify:CR=1 FL=1